MIIYYAEMIQGSEAWHSIRCGLPTASEMKLLVTPTLKVAANEKERAHMWELLAQRLTKHVEPRYISDDMLRGQEDEIEAVALYAKTYEPVERVGFITNDRWGFTVGYSPDALVGADGVFPAHAGMNRLRVSRGFLYRCVPRTRGDEPTVARTVTLYFWCSPHTRG